VTPNEFRRYALFYLGYYGALGAYTPYVGRWVDALGHGGYVVGAVLALWYGGRILAPPVWSRMTAASATPGRWLVGGCALALAGFATLAGAPPLAWMLGAMLWFALFFNAVMPQFEAMTLSTLGANNHAYGSIRVWGSIGFLVVAGTYGWLLDRFGDGMFVGLTLPWLALTVVAAWLHRRDAPLPQADAGPREPLWRRLGTKRLLGTVMLMQVGFGPFYVFYTLHLRANGHDGTAVGALWALGVLCEIAMFWQAPKLVQRFGAHRMLTACMVVTVARWLMVATLAESFAWMALAQATHAFGFAAFHAGVMRRMAELFPERRHMVGAQGLLYGIGGGIGGVLGALVSSVAWQHGGGGMAFALGALAALCALALHVGVARLHRAASHPA
jgi:PPP family 3-phenylpropionic acid transporter